MFSPLIRLLKVCFRGLLGSVSSFVVALYYILCSIFLLSLWILCTFSVLFLCHISHVSGLNEVMCLIKIFICSNSMSTVIHIEVNHHGVFASQPECYYIGGKSTVPESKILSKVTPLLCIISQWRNEYRGIARPCDTPLYQETVVLALRRSTNLKLLSPQIECHPKRFHHFFCFYFYLPILFQVSANSAKTMITRVNT